VVDVRQRLDAGFYGKIAAFNRERGGLKSTRFLRFTSTGMKPISVAPELKASVSSPVVAATAVSLGAPNAFASAVPARPRPINRHQCRGR